MAFVGMIRLYQLSTGVLYQQPCTMRMPSPNSGTGIDTLGYKQSHQLGSTTRKIGRGAQILKAFSLLPRGTGMHQTMMEIRGSMAIHGLPKPLTVKSQGRAALKKVKGLLMTSSLGNRINLTLRLFRMRTALSYFVFELDLFLSFNPGASSTHSLSTNSLI